MFVCGSIICKTNFGRKFANIVQAVSNLHLSASRPAALTPEFKQTDHNSDIRGLLERLASEKKVIGPLLEFPTRR